MTDQTNAEETTVDVFSMSEDELRTHRQDLVEQQEDAGTVEDMERLGRDIATVDMILTQHQMADEEDPRRLAELEEQENECYHRSLGIVDEDDSDTDTDDEDEEEEDFERSEDEDPCELNFN